MLFLPKAIRFPALVLTLSFLCAAAWSGTAFAQEEGSQNQPPASHTAEEVIDFEEDSDLVGHRHEEKTSYILYEERQKELRANSAAPQSVNATLQPGAFANSTNATGFGSQNATVSAPVKVVPPKGPQPSALRLFRFIPPSIFDNTIEGMREDEKQMLMNTGENEFWVLTALTEDELVIENKAPEADTQATLILFHASNGDIVAAMGVNAGDSCALELWRYLAGGRGITPMQMPDEPAVSDFFETHRVLPQDTDVSMLICLDPVEETLIAKPLIWTPSGLDQIVLDTKVIYTWNGDRFIKEVVPLN